MLFVEKKSIEQTRLESKNVNYKVSSANITVMGDSLSDPVPIP